MSSLYYNGITLPFVKTDDFSSTAIYDETAYRYTEHQISVTSVVSSSLLGTGLESWDDTITRIRHTLLTPRRLLGYFLDSAAATPTIGVSPETDLAGGPMPVSCDVIPTGATTAIVRFTVKCHTRDCNDVSLAFQPKYLSNRWKEYVDIDATDFRTIYTRSGTLRIRPDLGYSADDFRGIVTPPLRPGFTPHGQSKYEVSEDGLSLSYTCQQKEIWAVAPKPAVSASGTFQTISQDAAKIFGEVSVKLVGDTATSKVLLTQMAVAVAMDRIRRANPVADSKTGYMYLTGGIKEEMWDPVVSVHFRVMLKPAKIGGMSARAKEIINTAASRGVGLVQGLSGINLALWLLGVGGNAPKSGDAPTQTAPGAAKPNVTQETAKAIAEKLRPGGPKLENEAVPKSVGVLGFGEYPLLGDPNRNSPPDPGLRSTAGLRLAAAALNDPCLAQGLNEMYGPQYPVASADLDGGTYARGQLTEYRIESPDSEIIGRQSGFYPRKPFGGSEGRPKPRGGVFTPWGAAGRPRGRDAPRYDPNDPLGPSNQNGGWGKPQGDGGVGPGEERGGDSGSGSVRPFSTPSASVSIVPVPTVGNSESLASYSGGIYTDYTLEVAYHIDSGFKSSTEQKPGGVTLFHSCRPRTVTMSVSWTAQRIGEPPAVPAEDLVDPNFTMLTEDRSPGSVSLMPDGVTLNYSASGRREYGISDPSKVNMGSPIPPWIAEQMGQGHRAIVLGPKLVDYGKPVTDVPTSLSEMTLTGVAEVPAAGGLLPEWARNLQVFTGYPVEVPSTPAGGQAGGWGAG